MLTNEFERLQEENEQLKHELNVYKEMNWDDYKTLVFQQEKVIISLRASLEERIKQQVELIKEIKELKVK